MPQRVNIYSTFVDGVKPITQTDSLTDSITIDMEKDYDKDYVDTQMLSEKDVVFNQQFIESLCAEYNLSTNRFPVQ